MAVYELGIDEVGRGALAGPVVVVAAAILVNRKWAKLKDSKKLTAKQREAWCAFFETDPHIIFAVARIYPRQIEKRNISAAANLAAGRAYEKLIKKLNSGRRQHYKVFLDGGLYLRSKAWQSANVRLAKTIVKADEKFAAVSIASIIAKVDRDAFMRRMAKKHSKYGFEVHKGYGTAVHRAAVARYGPCEVHRLTFLKNWTRMYE